jgi:hypothetical protein
MVPITDDHFLASLVEFAEKGLSLPITLSVGGTTIEGTLIGVDEYFERLSELVQAGSPDQAKQAEDLREVLRGAPIAAVESAMKEIDEGANPEETRTISEMVSSLYIHLKDTQILLPNGDVIGMAAPWRGKLSAVAGFWSEAVIS